MWRSVQVNTRIDQPVERVFPYLADPLRWRAFAPACVYRRQIGIGPPVVGTRWQSTDRIVGPYRVHFVDELAELEPNRRVVWLSSAPWNARVEYACEPDGAGTRIHASYAGDISGSLRFVVGWLPGFVNHWILAGDFRRLRRLLAREASEAARWHRRRGSGPARAT